MGRGPGGVVDTFAPSLVSLGQLQLFGWATQCRCPQKKGRAGAVLPG